MALLLTTKIMEKDDYYQDLFGPQMHLLIVAFCKTLHPKWLKMALFMIHRVLLKGVDALRHREQCATSEKQNVAELTCAAVSLISRCYLDIIQPSPLMSLRFL